jgi:hypothetical protein
MPSENNLVIRDAATLELWRHQLRFTILPTRLASVEIRLPHMSSAENENLSARAHHLQRACGCGISGLFMSITIVFMLVSYFGAGSEFSDITIPDLLSFLGSTALAALCGKTLGLLWARWQLLTLEARLRRSMARA